MAAKDYSGTLATARRLVQRFGREFVIVKYDTTPANGSLPWKGPTDPRATATTTSVYAVVVPPSSLNELGEIADGELFKVADLILVAEPGVDYPESLETFNEVIDGTTRYAIKVAHKLKPGDTTLLYYLGVCR